MVLLLFFVWFVFFLHGSPFSLFRNHLPRTNDLDYLNRYFLIWKGIKDLLDKAEDSNYLLDYTCVLICFQNCLVNALHVEPEELTCRLKSVRLEPKTYPGTLKQFNALVSIWDICFICCRCFNLEICQEESS